MSHFINANPLNYDAKYPKSVDTSVNEEARFEVMKKNIGRKVVIKHQDCFDCEGQIIDIIKIPIKGYTIQVGENKYFAEESDFNFLDII